MPFWTFFGLGQGKATTRWPEGQDHGQVGVLGMPRYHPERCVAHCQACVEACLPGAITARETADAQSGHVAVDYGRCVNCQLCIEQCPEGAFTASEDWPFGAARRQDLVWQQAIASESGQALGKAVRGFGHSIHIRHVDAGSCNGCESELQALNNPFYNLHRLGFFFTASPRFADLLLVTGTVTYAMREPLKRAYEAMPNPRWVMATGSCAVSGGSNGPTYASGSGLDGVLPVDLYLPGCPPNPAAIIHALLVMMQRMPQRVRGGQIRD